MHDKPVSFDARRYHMVEPHEGSMWALAAYVPQAYARATELHREVLFFFFFSSSHLFASASVVRRVWGTYVSRLLRQPAGVCSQAAREQLTQRHLLVVRWVAGPRDGQLEERAGGSRRSGIPAAAVSDFVGHCLRSQVRQQCVIS